MILVTGITGFSGGYFLQELGNNNFSEQIRCIVRETSDTSLIDNSGLMIEKIFGDLNNQELLNKAMDGVDTVVHIGSIFYSIGVIRAAIENNVNRAILVHTTGIYSKYKSASEEYKNIEQSIKKIIEQSDSKLSIIYLRPTMIYGYINDRNMIIFIKMVDRMRLFPIINHGENFLQPVNGRDLGKAYYQVLCQTSINSGDYILSGEKPIKMIEILTLISSNLNKKTIFINVPLKVGEFFARCLKICTVGKVDYVERVQRMGEDRNYSHDEAQRDFNYQPMPFSEGLKNEIEGFLKEKNKEERA